MNQRDREISKMFERGCDMPDYTERVLDTINQHPEDLEQALAATPFKQEE